MLDQDDLINYELCFPGAVTGSKEVECQHCGEVLTVPVDDPMGEESYQCSAFKCSFNSARCEGISAFTQYPTDWTTTLAFSRVDDSTPPSLSRPAL